LSLALQVFMQGLVDYAGLFPPAALSVPDAVAEYADHRTSAESWMLGRFIATADKLPAIAREAAPHLVRNQVWPVSAIVGDRESSQAALAALPSQGKNVAGVVSAGLKVEVLETPMPADVNSGEDAAAFLDVLGAGLVAAELADCELFIEVKPGSRLPEILTAIAVFAAERVSRGHSSSRVGAKLRTGGLVAGAFPACEDIASVIAGCRQEHLALKFTAGLHHPIRHHNDDIGVMMHGFLNVFGAGLLAHTHNLSVPEITTILAETEATAFGFDETGFAWRHLKAEISTIRNLRSRSLCGFGSCSFSEPRDDLFGLALL
jgi:hypothetical protein